ncbi:MAG: class I SAM-dependent methyltransferase [Actinomycetota bacterium]
MGGRRFEVEFGIYSEWLVEACLALEIDPVPAVARGTGRPALLEAAAAPLDAKPGRRILDVGCGLGGPGAWLAQRSGAEVVGVDVMPQSVFGMTRILPELTGIVGSLRALPMKDRSFDAAWSLGVFEMVAHKAKAGAEIYRVLRPGAPLVIYDFVLVRDRRVHAPAADRFSLSDDMIRCLEDAGFEIRHASRLPQLPPTPPDWLEARDSVRAEVRRRHGDDDRYKTVQDELRTFRDLVSDGVIEDWMFVAERRADGGAEFRAPAGVSEGNADAGR